MTYFEVNMLPTCRNETERDTRPTKHILTETYVCKGYIIYPSEKRLK